MMRRSEYAYLSQILIFEISYLETFPIGKLHNICVARQNSPGLLYSERYGKGYFSFQCHTERLFLTGLLGFL